MAEKFGDCRILDSVFEGIGREEVAEALRGGFFTESLAFAQPQKTAPYRVVPPLVSVGVPKDQARSLRVDPPLGNRDKLITDVDRAISGFSHDQPSSLGEIHSVVRERIEFARTASREVKPIE